MYTKYCNSLIMKHFLPIDILVNCNFCNISYINVEFLFYVDLTLNFL